MKNYIGFINDHSGSMGHIAMAAMKDYNINITAVKDAATREMLDTVVSVVGVGIGKPTNEKSPYFHHDGYGCERQVMVSNPHVLKPITKWRADGGTPLYDGIGNMIELLDALPDVNKEDVSMLVMVTTDGKESHSFTYNTESISALIKERQATGRWTFVFRVPKGEEHRIRNLGVPPDNIQIWDTTTKGMEASTAINTAAMDGYFAARSAGKKSSGSFYADASKVDTSALKELDPKKISLYVVRDDQNAMWIRDFILTHRTEYLKGSAFYQLTKTEARVSHTKMIVIRDRATGKMYSGPEARKMIGLPDGRNARLHPGDHKEYDLFIQSESFNRHLVAGTGVLYWKDLGVPFTQAEIDRYTKPADPAIPKPAVVTLPQVTPTNRPTKSPLVPTPRAKPLNYFTTREDARRYCTSNGIAQTTIVDNGKGVMKQRRWSVA